MRQRREILLFSRIWQGPKLRVGEIEGGAIELSMGDEFVFTNNAGIGTKSSIYISYPDFARDVQVGEKILLDDGKMEVIVVEILEDEVRVKVTVPGTLLSKKGVNLPIPKFPCLLFPKKTCAISISSLRMKI